MKILDCLVTKIKGETFIIDKNIKFIDLTSIIIDKCISLVRGIVISTGTNRKTKKVFIGKRVKLINKKRIYINGSVRIGKFVEIDALSKNGVTLGNNVSIGDYSSIKCTGSLKKLGQGIKIGDNTGCGEYCFFGSAGGIEIGNDVIMGQNIRFHSENHNFDDISIPIRHQGVNSKGIIIGNDCWIGAGSVFLDGVRVGNGCVIGANTLINKDIPAYSVAVGNPVKIIKNRIKE